MGKKDYYEKNRNIILKKTKRILYKPQRINKRLSKRILYK